MAKSKAVIGTLRISTPAQLLSIQGTLVEQTAEFLTLDVKLPRTKKTVRTTFAASDVRLAFISEAVNETYLSVYGQSVDDYGDVELTEVQAGFFSGMLEGSAVLAAPGTWTFLPDEQAGEQAPAKPAAKAAAEKAPAKAGKPAKAAEPEPEEPEEEEEYEPAKGDNVTVTDSDGDETTGEVTAINAKTITVDGTKFTRVDVTVVPAEATEGDDTPPDEEYEPADGDYVKVTEGDEETEGTITGLTAKKLTLEDDDGETHSFILSKVTVEAATAPKKAAAKGGKAAAEKAPAKAPAKGGKAASDEADW